MTIDLRSYYHIAASILTESNIEYISELASLSVVKIADHLDLSTEFSHSSKEFRGTRDLERSERLIHISKALKATHYINVIHGKKKLTIQFDIINPRLF